MSIVAKRDAQRGEQRPSPSDRGLPNAWFVDEGHFQKEQNRLFHRTWVFAGVTGTLPDANTVKQIDVAGVPVVFTRNSAGELKAFQNVCPHRGARLVTEDNPKTKLMVCPYHSWTYDLDGKLVARPHFHGPGKHARMAPDEPFECDGLFPVRMGTWNGAVLINIDGKAPPLDEFLAPLNEVASDYDLSQMRFARMISSHFNSNWKLTIENFLDAYHVFAVHPTLDTMMEPAQRKAAIGHGNFVYSDYFNTDAGKDQYDVLPTLPSLPTELSNASLYGVQFPNWAVSIHPSYLLFWHFVPLAVDRTRTDLYALFVGDAATDEKNRAERDKLLDYYAALNEEDAGICRRMHEGRMAPAYDGGRFSPYWDGGTYHLAKLYREGMS